MSTPILAKHDCPQKKVGGKGSNCDITVHWYPYLWFIFNNILYCLIIVQMKIGSIMWYPGSLIPWALCNPPLRLSSISNSCCWEEGGGWGDSKGGGWYLRVGMSYLLMSFGETLYNHVKFQSWLYLKIDMDGTENNMQQCTNIQICCNISEWLIIKWSSPPSLSFPSKQSLMLKSCL